MELVVKNTFLDLVETSPTAARRCCSVPPMWKLTVSPDKQQLGVSAVRSDASTAASEDTCSLSDEELCRTPATHDEQLRPETPSTAKVTLCLDEIVVKDSVAIGRTGLDPKANAFEPSAVPPGEVCMVCTEVQMVLANEPAVLSARVAEGPMGGVTTIVVEVPASHSGVEELNAAKTMLLEAAANSECVYVLGYEAQPFVDFRDYTGFKAVLGNVPAAQEDSACWDTYQKGFCPRPRTCRWCHPRPSDLMQVVVTIKKRESDCDYEPMH